MTIYQNGKSFCHPFSHSIKNYKLRTFAANRQLRLRFGFGKMVDKGEGIEVKNDNCFLKLSTLS